MKVEGEWVRVRVKVEGGWVRVRVKVEGGWMRVRVEDRRCQEMPHLLRLRYHSPA